MLRINGFTLVELMISLSIMAILSAIAIPSFNHSTRKQQSELAISQLQRSLSLARQTAISQKVSVVVCPSFNGTQCSGDGNDWRAGGIVFIDLNGNKRYEPSEEVSGFLERIYPLNRGSRNNNSNNGNQLRSNADYISFNSYGMLNSAAQTFTYCDSSAQTSYNKSMTISTQGRMAIKRTANCNS